MKDVFEELIVVKRSGQRVNFNVYKIAVAIKNAFDNIDGKYNEVHINKIYEDVICYIEKNYEDRKTINVEDIQDIIESKLKEEKYIDVFNAFSEYRQKRAASRQVFTVKQQHKFAKAMERIADENILKSESRYTPNDILVKYGKTVLYEFSKSYIIDNKYLRSHEEGNIFIHDMASFPLGMLSHTHLKLDDYFLDKSFNEFIKHIKGSKDEVSGEVSILSLDAIISKYVLGKFKCFYKEFLENYLKVVGVNEYINIKKIFELIDSEETIPFNQELYEAFILTDRVREVFRCAYDDAFVKVEGVVYKKINELFLELNSLSNARYSISFGSYESVIGLMVSEAIIKNLSEMSFLENLSVIYKVKREDKFIDSICDLIIENKNIVLTFQNDRNVGDFYFANGARIYENVNDEVGSVGRSVIGTTSINMARLGLKYESASKKKLYMKLDELLELAKNELLLTFEMVGNKSKDNYKILFNGNILNDEKLESGGRIRKVIKNGVLVIGLVGLGECVNALCKDEDKRGKMLVEILKYISDKCKEYTRETKLNFVMCEPYKSDANKEFMALDKAIYGIRNGVTDKNSYDLVSNLPFFKGDYVKLGQIQKQFTGGSMIEVRIDKSITHKKMMGIINDLVNSDVGVVRFVRSSSCK